MRSWFGRSAGVLALSMAGCASRLLQPTQPPAPADFFPLADASRWEYVVRHFPGGKAFKFIAVVRGERFVAAAGRRCRVVDETYTGFGGGFAHPVAYCRRGGFLDRVMSIEYQGTRLRDNGLKSVERRFLPVVLAPGISWEGLTNAYQLPDGSGYVVRQVHRAMLERDVVEVPAGRFQDCLRVETKALHNARNRERVIGPTVIFYYVDWYAPGVGLVKTLQTARRGEAQPISQIELLSYDVFAEARRQP